jgi:hypothetical protein
MLLISSIFIGLSAAGDEGHLYVVPATNLSLLRQMKEPSALNKKWNMRWKRERPTADLRMVKMFSPTHHHDHDQQLTRRPRASAQADKMMCNGTLESGRTPLAWFNLRAV